MTSSIPALKPATLRRRPELDALAARAVEHHRAAPCAVVAAAFLRDGQWHVGEGAHGAQMPGGATADTDTVFDLASVTKPFTAVTLARVLRHGLISRETQLGVLVREAQGTPSGHIPIELLLAHRAGLEGHRPLYAPLEHGREVDRYAALVECATARRPDCTGDPGPEGFAPLYSDLGYLLLGTAMARASGVVLDALVEREVIAPLGLTAGSARQWRARCAHFHERVAPTEVVPWRGGLVHAVVHDENAFALGGQGVCGHAGMFGTARDVAVFGAALLDVLSGRGKDWLEPADLQPLIRVRPGGTLRAGFDGKSEVGSSAGTRCSMAAFGHLGFTGTSLWIDPEQSVAVCMLSNRVHPTRNNDAIKAARPDVHDGLFAWAREQPVAPR
ncbi:MAG: beta-lactamase family protein [Deltaproteobacteria bacterium]|nr:beta-lactamase family protein [Deltaproteobacteria bacterium]